jgi:hypothetical protein
VLAGFAGAAAPLTGGGARTAAARDRGGERPRRRETAAARDRGGENYQMKTVADSTEARRHLICNFDLCARGGQALARPRRANASMVTAARSTNAVTMNW